MMKYMKFGLPCICLMLAMLLLLAFSYQANVIFQLANAMLRPLTAPACNCHCTDDPWKSIDPNSMSAAQIFEYFRWTNSQSCKVSFDFGGHIRTDGIDGQKAVCMDQGVAPETKKCFIYSFGISYEWSFDRHMDEFGCQVYAFDPSLNLSDHDYTKNIHFYRLGLSHEDADQGENGWKLRTLESIYKMLEPKHGKGVAIDYLKMDVEHSEWDTLMQVLKSGIFEKVKQLAVEILFRDTDVTSLRKFARVLKSVENYGFVRFASRPNIWTASAMQILNGQKDYHAYEVAWYNKKYLV